MRNKQISELLLSIKIYVKSFKFLMVNPPKVNIGAKKQSRRHIQKYLILCISSQKIIDIQPQSFIYLLPIQQNIVIWQGPPNDFYNINFQMSNNSHNDKDLVQNNKSTVISRQIDQKQKYIKKIHYQAHKLSAFYIQRSFAQKKLNKIPPNYQSIIQIQTPLDIILSIEDVLNFQEKLKKKMLPTAIPMCTLTGSQVRLGLSWKSTNEFQALIQIQNIKANIRTLGSRFSDIKSVEIINESQKKQLKINLDQLCAWLVSKIFRKSNQIYLLLIPASELSFLHNQKIDFVQISPNQYLVHSGNIIDSQNSENYSKLWCFFDNLFEKVFANNNLKANQLNHLQIKQILDHLKQQPRPMQVQASKQYYQFTCNESEISARILKEERQNVIKFLQGCLKKSQHKNDRKLRSLGAVPSYQDLIKDMLKLYTQKDDSITVQTDLDAIIQKANQQLRQNGLFSLVGPWKYVLRQKILQSLNNFQIYQADSKEQLLLFARLHELNLLRIEQQLKNLVLKKLLDQKLKTIYETIYPGINSVVQKILEKLGAKALYFYLQNYKKQNQKRCLSSNQLQTQFIQNIKKQLGCCQTNQNQKIFLQRVKEIIVQPDQPSLKKSGSSKQEQTSKNSFSYFQNIENQRIMDISCLGCTNFFFQQLNICQPTINQVPLKIFRDINELKDSNAAFVDTISGMLNSGGGIILFGFQESNGEIKTVGKMMSQKQKEMVQHRMAATMNLVYPKVEKKEWVFNFIPVYKNPLLQKDTVNLKMVSYKGIQQLMKPNQSYLQRNPMKGMYVGRIIIKPLDMTKFYLYSFKKQKSNERVYANIFENGQVKELPMRNIRRILRKRMRMHHFSDQLKIFQNTMLKSDRFFQHQCISPESGRQVAESKVAGRHPYKKQSFVQMFLDPPQIKPKYY